MKQSSNPRVVVIGGGTGLSTMLRGLKHHTKNITAVVTVGDDGGGSGVLRRELGMPPPGDIRNCIQALANTEPTVEALMAYRFQDGSLKGQSFGNLLLAALNGMSDSFDQAVMKMSEVLAITGRVLPVTNEDIQLVAEFDDGSEREGESHIFDSKKHDDCHITRLRLRPENPQALPAVVEAIEDAEMIIIGPGSLYTSIMPNLLTKGVPEAIAASDALKVYVLNVMTQEGETEGYSASDHVRVLRGHAGCALFDYCLANNMELPRDILERYCAEGAEPTRVDEQELLSMGVSVEYAPVAGWKTGYIRHDPDALAEALMSLFREKSHTKIFDGRG